MTIAPVAVYQSGLRSAGGTLWLVDEDGARTPLPVTAWRGGLDAADEALLSRCPGPTIDVGCGPGRLAAALAARSVPALGIDVAPAAVAMARRLGASALRRDVFGRVPAAGRWHRALLADGNVGIGGDPVHLLERVGALLGPAGRLLVEVAGPGSPSRRRTVRLAGEDGALSAPFGWAEVGVDGLDATARAAGLAVEELWDVGGRHFGALTRRTIMTTIAPAHTAPSTISRLRP